MASLFVCLLLSGRTLVLYSTGLMLHGHAARCMSKPEHGAQPTSEAAGGKRQPTDYQPTTHPTRPATFSPQHGPAVRATVRGAAVVVVVVVAVVVVVSCCYFRFYLYSLAVAPAAPKPPPCRSALTIGQGGRAQSHRAAAIRHHAPTRAATATAVSATPTPGPVSTTTMATLMMLITLMITRSLATRPSLIIRESLHSILSSPPTHTCCQHALAETWPPDPTIQ
jgi:hypothetical protein